MAPPPTACQIVAEVATGARDVPASVELTLQRIREHDQELGAFLDVTEEHARELANRPPVGAAPPLLAGVPIAVKDNICTRAGRTTCGSKTLADYVSPYDATAVRRLEASGAVPVGKTNLDEFGMGSSGEFSAWHPTRNPWNRDHVAGGSSSGSAAAVAAGLVPIALGSDTGGSIRVPASFCGCVGLKPTYGRVSRYGLVAYGSSLEQIGVLAGCVKDAALVLDAISGPDPQDATSVAEPVPNYLAAVRDAAPPGAQHPLRVGIVRAQLDSDLHPETRAAIENAINIFRASGATIVEVDLPHARFGIATYYLLVSAEAASNLARYDGVHFGFRDPAPITLAALNRQSRTQGLGPEVQRRILLGTFALSAGYHDAYYDRAARVRRLIRQDYERAFQNCDTLLGPTTAGPAFRFGQRTADPLTMYLTDTFTIGANLAGLPAIALPAGLTRAGLPLSIQLMGPTFGEAGMLRAARMFERQFDWPARRPPLAGA